MKSKRVILFIATLLFSPISQAGWSDLFGCKSFFANFSQTNRAHQKYLKMTAEENEVMQSGTKDQLLTYLKTYENDLEAKDLKRMIEIAKKNQSSEKLEILLKLQKRSEERAEIALNQRLQRAKERFVTNKLDATQTKNQEVLMQYAMQLIYAGKAEDLAVLIKAYPDFKFTEATYSNMSLLYASFSQRCFECFKVVRYNGGVLNARNAIHLQKTNEYDIPVKVQRALIEREPEYFKVYME